MAARENQGYLIGIIVLSILSVVLLLFAVLSTMKAYENYDKLQASLSDATLNKALADSWQTKSDLLAAMIGLEGKTTAEIATLLGSFDRFARNVNPDQASQVTAVRESAEAANAIYNDDMKLNAASAAAGESAEADLTWKGTINKLTASMSGLNTRLYSNNQESRKVQQDAEDKLTNMKARLDENAKTLSDTKAALVDEKKRNALKEDELNQSVQTAQNKLQALAQESTDQLEIKENEIAALTKERDDAVKNNAIQRVLDN